MKQEFYPGRIYENRKIGGGQISRKYHQLREKAGGGGGPPERDQTNIQKMQLEF